ncbi:hypothetical protein JTB14_000113 [Gonioctena quinquepunctata]|nr:hypothetical protein JTB14_000113 [Gonioctena quinquepunctata]
MLTKNPKPAYRKWLKRGALTLFVVEAACFAGSYFLWYKVNTKRDYRKYLHDNYPSILEIYYRTGETFDSQNKVRELDQAYWLLATPSESDVKKLKQQVGVDAQHKEINSKKQQFMNVLQAATENTKPIYRLTKEEIEKELKK